MTSAVQDVWQALDAAERLPFGLERSALIESLVAEADRLADEKLALVTRLQLVTSYSYGGEPLRQFPVFSWLLDRYKATPKLFDEADRYRLLWMFKWVTIGVTHHPAVTRSRIESRLEEMAEHYAAAGEGPAPVLSCRYQVKAQLDGYESAEEAFLTWIGTPRTALSDCEACEPGIRVRHLVATGRPADALTEAEPVLRFGGCADQPQQTIGHALEPLLQCGFGERAGQEHLHGIRLLRSVGGSPTTWARHVMACARGGQLRRGLDLLEDRLPDLDSAPTPWDAMWLSAAGARLMAGLRLAGDAELPVAGAVSATGAPATVSDVFEQLTESAQKLAARFDGRNRTTAVSERVERWLNAPELPTLRLGDVVTRRRAGPAGTRTTGTKPGETCADLADPGQLDSTEVTALPGLWQAALDSGIAVRRREVLDRWRQARSHPVAGQLPAVTVARLEAALAIDALDTGTVSLRDARGAAQLLREGGDPLGALLHELTCLRRELAGGADPDAVLARAESLVTKGFQLDSAASGCLHVGLVALLQAAGRPIDVAVERALAVTGSVDPAQLAPVQRGCLALLLRDRAAGLPDPDQKATLKHAMALLRPGERVQERALVTLALGTSLVRSGSLRQARELIASAADDAAAAGDQELAGHAAHALGRACHLSGDLAEAIQVFRDLLVQLGPDADPLLLAQTRQDLAYALHGSGRQIDAAELAETALDDLEEQLAETGLTSPDDLDWVILGKAIAAGDGPVPSTVPVEAPVAVPAPDTATRRQPPEANRSRREARLAGTLAFTAALFSQNLGEHANACGLAQRSAAWHRGAGSARAEAESLELAARSSPDPREAIGLLQRASQLQAGEGRWGDTARCLRDLALPLLEVAGLDAAETVLYQAQAALDAVAGSPSPSPTHQNRLVWERLALTEQVARVLAAAGQLSRALDTCQGLDSAFRTLDDARSARNVIGLRAQVLEELGRVEECLTELHEAALEARSAGDERQAQQLGGYLAAFLDDLGQHDEADAVWKLFAFRPNPPLIEPSPDRTPPAGTDRPTPD